MDAGDAAGFQPVSVYADVRVWDMVDWAQLYLFELIFMRMSGFLLFNPLLGRSNLPAMVKTGMALVLSILVFGTAGTGVPQPDTLVELAFRLLLELGIGLVLGFVMRVVFSVVQIGGEVIDTQMGMTMAQIYDASTYVKNYTYLGTVEAVDGRGFVKIEQKNKFTAGQVLEVMKPDGRNVPARVEAIYDEEGVSVDSAPHPKQILYVDLGGAADVHDILRIKL